MLVVESRYRNDGDFVLVCTDDSGGRQYMPVSEASYQTFDVPEIAPENA